jgi:phosphotransferase system HPr (HPr) family protein
MDTIKATLVVEHKDGIHLRPLALFIQTAGAYQQATIKVRNVTRDTPFKNAKSIFSVQSIAVSQGHTIEIEAEGEGAEEAIQALTDLVESNFGEGEET